MRKTPADVPGQQPVLVDACDRCGSVFLEYFDGEPGALARALAATGDAPPEGVATSGDRPTCPDCELPLELRRYLDQGPFVHRCGACLAVFATPLQLRALADHRMHADPEPTFLDRLLALWGRSGP